jgi:hypothetical protein
MLLGCCNLITGISCPDHAMLPLLADRQKVQVLRIASTLKFIQPSHVVHATAIADPLFSQQEYHTDYPPV